MLRGRGRAGSPGFFWRLRGNCACPARLESPTIRSLVSIGGPEPNPRTRRADAREAADPSSASKSGARSRRCSAAWEFVPGAGRLALAGRRLGTLREH